jgi:hypothetical protein
MVLGGISIQSNSNPLVEPLQVGKDNAANRALGPIENARNFLECNAEDHEMSTPPSMAKPQQPSRTWEWTR